jgi:hypothetical protein
MTNWRADRPWPEIPCGCCHTCGLTLETVYGTGAAPLEWCDECREIRDYQLHRPGAADWARGHYWERLVKIELTEGSCGDSVCPLPGLTAIEHNGRVLEVGMDVENDSPLPLGAASRRTWIECFGRVKVTQEIKVCIESRFHRTDAGGYLGGTGGFYPLSAARPLEKQLNLFAAALPARERRTA